MEGYKIKFIWIGVLFLMLPIGCRKKTPTQPQFHKPIYDNALTNSNGECIIKVGTHTFNLKVQNENGEPLSQMFVEVFLLQDTLSLKEYAVITVRDTINREYYPYFDIRPLSENHLLSPEEPQGIIITMVLVGMGMLAYEFFISESEILYHGGLCFETRNNLTIEELFDVIVSIATVGTGGTGKAGAVMKLASEAKDALDAIYEGASIASYLTENYLVDEFAALMQYYFNLMHTDLVDVSIFWLCGENRWVPFLKINSVIFNRNYKYKFTLTWGEHPRDLDIHLWTPPIQGQSYHVYYANMGSLDSPPYAALDVDDVTSWGPENMTIKQTFPGIYYLAIHDFSGDGTITTSGATVKIYDENGYIEALHVPSGYSEANWWWHVLKINGATGEYTIIDSVSQNPPVGKTNFFLSKKRR